jgi:hypothetical protein
MNNNCLNCNESVHGNFCNNCGQKTSTHQFSLKHFFIHDFVHGIFHLDKGFLFTLKELFTRPGHSIREYVQGKRVKHFNCFATLILLLTIGYFLSKGAKIDMSQIFEYPNTITGLLKVLKDYSKIVVFLGVPIYSFASFLLFKKSKQNYTENLVLNLYMLCGAVAIGLLMNLCMIFSNNISFLQIVHQITFILVLTYIFIYYYQYFSVFKYNKVSLIIRVLVMTVIYLVAKKSINVILNEIGLKYFH